MHEKLIRAAVAFLALALMWAGTRAQNSAHASAQQSEDRIALHQALLDLTNPWTVMCVAAHPDDEDGTSLIVMRRKYGAHTVSLFSTFGEGGQNAIGPELYEELGAIRARETMAASEIQGSAPAFLGLKDFGFSKSADETFQKWGHEEALRRMVLHIRKLRPDVIITNHSVTSNDHGHHQATARLVVEAFDAAADPKRFPEQLKDGVEVWQVQRLFVRVRGQNPDRQGGGEPIVTIDPNERDPIRGTLFAEQALSALQKHATQGPWPKSVAQLASRFTNTTGGRLPLTRYRLAREAKAASAFPKDPQTFLDGLRLPERFSTDADVPLIDGKPLVEFAAERSKVLEVLLKYAAKGYRFSFDATDFKRLDLMRNRIDRALAVVAGIGMQVSVSRMVVTPNSHMDIKITITNKGSHTLYSLECSSEFASLRKPVDPSKMSGGPTSILTTYSELKGGEAVTKEETIKIPGEAPINLPVAQHLYEPSPMGLPLVTQCTPSVGAVRIHGTRVISTMNLDVAPTIEITRTNPALIVVTPQTEKSARVLMFEVMNHGNETVHTAMEAIAAFDNPGKKETKVKELPVSLAPGEKRDLVMKLPEMKTRTETVLVTRRFPLTGSAPAATPEPPRPPSNPRLLLRANNRSSNEVTIPFVYVKAQVSGNLDVGYIRGFDYSLPDALTALGVESKELTIDDVKSADLSKFSTIIVDNRVYESKPEFISANQKLLDYARDGGTLIVFYHKSDEWNPDPRRNRPQLAPYKLVLGNARITDENASVSFIEPQHALLNFPNKLGPEDFAGWIQERGLYYPKEWDQQFHALLQSNDPGEAPLKGGLLVADYGKGHYVYSSMVWYRQLRAGVPGAYRMLANMISYGRTK